MPASWNWLAGRPPPPCIPEERPVHFEDGPLEINTGRGGPASSGVREHSGPRAVTHRGLLSLLDTILGSNSPSSTLGTSSASGGMVTEADASEGTGDLQSVAEADQEAPANVYFEALAAMDGDDGSDGEQEEGSDSEDDPEEYPGNPFWSTFPLRREGCLALPPPTYECGLPLWQEGLPRSHEYALIPLDEDGAGLPCFPHEVRTSVRWHLDHPGQRPRSTRWSCISCNLQDAQERIDFVENWKWRNKQAGNGTHYRTVEPKAVNQFHWPRHVEFPPTKLANLSWPPQEDETSQ